MRSMGRRRRLLHWAVDPRFDVPAPAQERNQDGIGFTAVEQGPRVLLRHPLRGDPSGGEVERSSPKGVDGQLPDRGDTEAPGRQTAKHDEHSG
jgi:hypothetical protein